MFLVLANSESGEDYGVIYVSNERLTVEVLDEITSNEIRGDDGWTEEHDGPGHNGSWLHLEIQEYPGTYVPPSTAEIFGLK